MAHEIFLSYAQPDRNVADAVCARLEGRGIRCWYAPRNILPGAQWSASIIDAIAGAEIMVIVFSAHSNGSPHVRNEIERAVGKNLHIIPFRIEDVKPSKEIELFVSSPHWLDAISPPIERHIERLAETIELVLAHRRGEGPEAPPTDAGSVPAAAAPRARTGRRLLLVAVVLALVAGAVSFGVLGRFGGPTAEEIARTFGEVDLLHRETRGLRFAAHDAVRKPLAMAESARERAGGHQAREEFEVAAGLLATASENYRLAITVDRAAGKADDRKGAAEEAARAQQWARHPAVDGLLREAEQHVAAGGDASTRGEFDAAADSFESAVVEYERAAAVNASLLAAAAARERFDRAVVTPPRSTLNPVVSAAETITSDAGRAAIAFKEGEFIDAEQIWVEALAALEDLLRRDDTARALEELRGDARQGLEAPDDAWYLPLRTELERERALVEEAALLLESEESWGDARTRFRAAIGRLSALRARHDAAESSARRTLASVPVAGFLAKRFPELALRENALREQASAEIAGGDFDAIEAIVGRIRGLRTEMAKENDAVKSAAEAGLSTLDAAYAEVPDPIYLALRTRREELASAVGAARKSMTLGDYDAVESAVTALVARARSLASEHAEARERALGAQRGWQAYVRGLPTGVRPTDEVNRSVEDAETALREADFDAAIRLFRGARETMEGFVRVWSLSKALGPGTVWRGEIRSGRITGDFVLTFSTRDGEKLTGRATLIIGTTTFSGTINGTAIYLVVDKIGGHRGFNKLVLTGTLKGNRITGTSKNDNANGTFEVDKD